MHLVYSKCRKVKSSKQVSYLVQPPLFWDSVFVTGLARSVRVRELASQCSFLQDVRHGHLGLL